MAEEVKLPELGESVTEAIVTAWLVEVGDTVEVDQPLFEISTDKVDTEVPSPVAGTLLERKAEVDDTIEPGQVIAIIGEGDEQPQAEEEPEPEPEADEQPEPEAEPEAEEEPETEAEGEAPAAEEAAEEPEAEEEPETEAEPEAEEEAAPEAEPEAEEGPEAEPESEAETEPEAEPEAESEPARQPRSVGPSREVAVSGEDALASPLVRKMLREAGIAPDLVQGSGEGGRITRADAEAAVASGGAPRPAAAAHAPRPEASPTQIEFEGERSKTIELTRIRKSIAKHMLESMQTTAQLTTAVEADMSRIMHLRGGAKGRFKQREGISLSPLPFVARAVCLTIPRHPIVNGRIDTDEGTATYHDYVNLGIAVDTERGLLVPNIKDAQDLTVTELAHAIVDLAERTRGKGLQPDDIAGGTFTITSTGSRGALWDTPILNPPEVAILGAAVIEKRPVVIESELGDAIAIRQMSYLALTYDHRLVDGADAARFLADLKWVLENHDFSDEV